MWTIVWIFISFFAVIGVVEFTFSILEAFSMYSTKSVEEIALEVHIKGKEPHVGFVLSSLLIMAERISINRKVARVKVYDAGMDEETLLQVKEYIERNEGVVLVETATDV